MSFLEVLRAEAARVFGDFAIMLTIFAGVIVYAFLYPQPYLKQSVSGLPLSIVDYDGSTLSRQITFMLGATPNVKIVRKDLSEKNALAALERGEVKALVIIPPHFEKDVRLGNSPTVAVGVDNSYFLIYGSVLESAMKTILTQNAVVKIATELKNGAGLAEAIHGAEPWRLQTLNLFNKDNSYTQYIVPAVFMLILQQTLLIGIGILGGGINEALSERRRFYYMKAKLLRHVIPARMLIFGSIFSIHLLFYLGFMFEFYGITRVADPVQLLALSVAFLLAVILFGNFLGALFPYREMATPVVLFSSLPLVFSVGFIWPIEAMPAFAHDLAMLAPSTPAIEAFLKLNQMGASFADILPQITALSIQAALYGILGYAVMTYRRKTPLKQTALPV